MVFILFGKDIGSNRFGGLCIDNYILSIICCELVYDV